MKLGTIIDTTYERIDLYNVLQADWCNKWGGEQERSRRIQNIFEMERLDTDIAGTRHCEEDLLRIAF